MDNSEFIQSFKNNAEPLVSIKNLLIELSKHTQKTLSKTAQDVLSLLIGYKQNGAYLNSFSYCSIYDLSQKDVISISMQSDFSDSQNYLKEPLEQAIAKNSADIEDLNNLAVNRREFIERLKVFNITLLNPVTPISTQLISQNKGDYISLYDLIEWAKNETGFNYTDTANDILRIIGDRYISLYREYGGLKPCIETDKQSFKNALQFMAKNNGYEEIFDDDIPF